MPLDTKKRKGSPHWYVRGTYLGVRVYESARTTKRTVAKRRQREIERGIEKSGGVPRHTFGDAADEYLKICPDGETAYVERLLDYFEGTLLMDIDQAAIERCVAAHYPAAQPSTINRNIITPVAAILHRGAELGMCPWIRVKRRKEPKGRDVVITPDQAEALLAAASDKLRPIVMFMLTTGCRAGEAIKLKWEDVDLSRSHVTFRDTKNGETYGCHLHQATVAELANLTKRNDSVFGYTYVNRKALNRDFNAACKKAGIPDFTPHGLRHTYATWLRQNGEDLRSLMALGRWKDVKSVARYTHVSVKEQRDAIDKLPVSFSERKEASAD